MRRKDHSCPRLNEPLGGLTLTITLFLAGCGLPLDGPTISSMLAGLAADNASACITISAGGGVGALAITPVPTIPMGGGGYASLVACRSNEPGSVILVKANGDLELYHGVFKIPVEERELKELRDRIEKFEEIPSVFILPKMPGEF